MKAELLTCSVIHADETVVQVLNEPNKKANTDSRMWVYCAGKYEEHSNILFEYSPKAARIESRFVMPSLYLRMNPLLRFQINT